MKQNQERHDFPYWTLEKLLKWSRADQLRLFQCLDAPLADEMNGEYMIRYPLYIEEDIQGFFSRPDSNGRGTRHLGKCYHPALSAGGLPGQGYNWWLKGKEVHRFSRFAWEIGTSRLDGRPALVMEYKCFRNLSKNGETGLHDEIRRVYPGLYMGIAHNEVWPNAPFMTAWDFEKGRTQDEVFFLFGPVGPWHGPDDPSLEPEV